MASGGGGGGGGGGDESKSKPMIAPLFTGRLAAPPGGRKKGSGIGGGGAHPLGPSPMGSTNSEKHEFRSKGVDCVQLNKLMAAPEKLMLIDARPYSEYVDGHVRGALSVRLSGLMTRRLARGKLRLHDLVVNEQKELFRKSFDDPDCCAIVYDKCTPAAKGCGPYSAKNPMHVILKALEVEAPGKLCHYILGGYDAVRQGYPDSIDVPQMVISDCMPLTISMDEPLTATLVSPSPGMFTAGSRSSTMSLGGEARRIMTILPSEILPHLFIGSRRDAANKELLQSLGITHILNATKDCPFHHEADFTYCRIPVEDTWNQNLPDHFDKAFEFIEMVKRTEKAKVMVHCTAGISRSSTITIAYIMNDQRLSLHDAYSHVRVKRPIVAPNLDFMGELMAFEKQLGITPTALVTGTPIMSPEDMKDAPFSPEESGMAPAPAPAPSLASASLPLPPSTPGLGQSDSGAGANGIRRSTRDSSIKVTEIAPWPQTNGKSEK